MPPRLRSAGAIKTSLISWPLSKWWTFVPLYVMGLPSPVKRPQECQLGVAPDSPTKQMIISHVVELSSSSIRSANGGARSTRLWDRYKLQQSFACRESKNSVFDSSLSLSSEFPFRQLPIDTEKWRSNLELPINSHWIGAQFCKAVKLAVLWHN